MKRVYERAGEARACARERERARESPCVFCVYLYLFRIHHTVSRNKKCEIVAAVTHEQSHLRVERKRQRERQRERERERTD